MKTIKTLHLASFEGNIGDNANHNGVRRLWKEQMPHYDFQVEELEIRGTYWKKWEFDKEFVDYVNKFDLFVIGGGNYFEMWVEHSPTGTSVAIPPELMSQIKTPTVFYALGLDPYMGAPEECVTKFKIFLDQIFAAPNRLVSVRNDGSMASARRVLGEKYAQHIHLMPDGGFFVTPKEADHPELFNGARTIGVNLAGDMLDFRFGGKDGSGSMLFLQDLTDVLQEVMEKSNDINLVFYPHIPKDFHLINEFCKIFPDPFLRRRVTIAPYLHGKGAEEYLFDIYRKTSMTIGNRLHANICSVGLNTPSVGLVTHPQIGELYSEIGLSDRCVATAVPDFRVQLFNMLEYTLENEALIKDRYVAAMLNVRKQANAFLRIMDDWLADNL